MATTTPASMTLLLLVVAPHRAAVQPPTEGPRAILLRAVAATGGEKRLERLRQVRETVRGTIAVSGQRVPFQRVTTFRLPTHFRTETTTEIGGKRWHVIQVFDGKNGWTRENDITIDADARTVAGWRESMHAHEVSTLLPLLAPDGGYTLTDLGMSEVNARPVRGIRVECKQRREVRLFFDSETALLVKMIYQPREKGGGEAQEEIYSGYQEVDGMKRPTRVQILINQMQTAEIQIEKRQFLDRVDDREFAKP